MLRSLSRLTVPNSTYNISKRRKTATAAASRVASRRERNLDSTIYISEPSVADIAAETLKTDIAKGRLILESNPGPGLLTERLLKMGCNKLRLFSDSESSFIEQLIRIRDENPTRVKLIMENFLRMASVVVCDLHQGTSRSRKFLTDIPAQSWDEEPSTTAVVAVPASLERRFMLSLLYSLAARSTIFSLGRVEFLLFVSSIENTSILIKKRRGRPAPVLFSLFFNCEFVQSVGSEGFSTEKPGRSKTPRSQMSLVRLTPKTDIFSRLSEPRRVEEFVFFVKQAYRRGATLMYLNQLIPDAVRFILLRTRWSQAELLDLRHDTKLSSLSPEDILRLFEIFTQHNLYPQCPVAAGLEADSFGEK